MKESVSGTAADVQEGVKSAAADVQEVVRDAEEVRGGGWVVKAGRVWPCLTRPLPRPSAATSPRPLLSPAPTQQGGREKLGYAKQKAEDVAGDVEGSAKVGAGKR